MKKNNEIYQSVLSNALMVLILNLMLLYTGSSANCQTNIGYNNACDRHPYCYQKSYGSYYSCPDSLDSSGKYYYTSKTYYYCSNLNINCYWDNDNGVWISCCYIQAPYTINIYQDCHPRCLSCYGAGFSQCDSCKAPYFHWQIVSGWQTSRTCQDYCPRVGYHQGKSFVGQYRSSSSTQCQNCSAGCTWCQDYADNLKCYTCQQGYYLIDDTFNDICDTIFAFDFGSSGGSCSTDLRCYTSCPRYFFPVTKADSINYLYTSYRYRVDDAATSVQTMRQSDICIPCDYRCRNCFNDNYWSCSDCTMYSYKWFQSGHNTICLHYCPIGDYMYGVNLYYGQYISTPGNRICAPCNINCRFCINSSDKCYMCRDGSFLLDDKATCLSRFLQGDLLQPASKTNCRKCKEFSSTYPNEVCQTKDNLCKETKCPDYFYFQTYRTNNQNSTDLSIKHQSSRNPAYAWYVNASTISGNNYTQSYVYRYQTNLCILCDKRCIRCHGPTNMNCTQCVNGYFKWNQEPICAQSCPTMEYEDHFNATSNYHNTECKYCHPRCIECDIYFDNCTRCKGEQAQYPNLGVYANSSYMYTFNDSYSTCLQYCPVSQTPSTGKGWYGSIKTQTCYQCPGGCSNCNINITILDQNIYCTDDYCSQGISCTSCLLGYVKVSGKCIAQKNCQKYAYYLPGNVSTQWTPDKCFCIRGYFMNAYVSCDLLCDISCKSCNITQCTQCQQGYTLVSNACTQTQTLTRSFHSTSSTSGGFTNSPPAETSTCGPHSLIFGYRKTQANKYITYQSIQITTRDYYGVSIKARVLFIDKWPSTGAIKIHHNSINSAPVFTYTFDTLGAYGQQACGTNDLDYLITIYTEYKYTPTTDNVTLYISSNADLFSSYPNWGVKDIVITTLKCHAVCLTCTGPLQTDCKTCTDTLRRVVNSTCTCDTSSGSYQQGLVCRSVCDAGYYKDTITAKCVLPSGCTAPKRFADPTTLSCVQNCPQNGATLYYAHQSTRRCVASCASTTYQEYKYDGASRSCQDICPTNFIAYGPPVLYSDWRCVAKCPIGWYLNLQNRLTNPKCSDICPTGWQDQDLAQCVNNCPNGYFKQTLLGQNRCVKTCTSMFGLNSTGFCVASCPHPLFADPTKQLCQKQCPDNHFYQIALIGGNRTCVTVCEQDQWENPFIKSCQKSPMKCPDGYFADNSTNKCQPTCTQLGQVGQNTTRMCQPTCITGFAHWDTKMCVSICPSIPSMFSYVNGSTRICVNSCNTSATGLFGDAQQNRSCVPKCSSSTTPTFGQVSTSLCVDKCSVVNEHGDPLHVTRRCTTTCTTSPQTYSYDVTKLCLTVCPDKYFGDKYTVAGKGVCASGCPSSYYGDPLLHLCVGTCPSDYFGSPLTGRPCVQKCPITYYGQNKTGNRVCVQQCDLGFWADQMTRLCTDIKIQCSNNTYADYTQRKCVNATLCSINTYADSFTKGCQVSCSNSSYFGDPFIHTCVSICSQIPQQYSQAGYCVTTCTGGKFSDFQDSRKCNIDCSRTPLALYGNKNTWKCVLPVNCPVGYFADNLTLSCVNLCTGSLPYGDLISNQCVLNCPDNYYGQLASNLCVQFCNPLTLHYADNITGNCQTACTSPTYGSNSSSSPKCQNQCPLGSYAKDGIRVCVLDCGSGSYGNPVTRKCYSDPLMCSNKYYANSLSNLCVLPADCQTVTSKHYFAQNSTKTCVSQCLTPNYGDSILWLCVPQCNTTHYGQNTTRQCLSGCSTYLSFAQPQLHLCVARCSAGPVSLFADRVNYKCVQPKNCPVNSYAENQTRVCVQYCPKTPVMTYADVYVTKICVLKCPDTYYADDSNILGGNCVINCVGDLRFRQNSTKSCVNICPLAQGTFGYVIGDMCVKTCPDGYFAQQDANRRCVQTCAGNSWGNKITKICIINPLLECPPDTWADDNTNLCEQVCSLTPAVYGYNLTRKCIASCPSPTFAYDITRVCIDICPASLVDSGYFGDPDMLPTRKCVKTCQTAGLYRDVAASRTCKSTCTFNSTYKTYKDPTRMSCQAICSDYPQVRYADDLSQSCQISCSNGGLKKSDKTRSCVSTCTLLYQPNQNKCVQKCPMHSSLNVPFYADLTLKTCVKANDCPSDTYASDDSMECLSTCPANTYKNGKQCVYYCPDNSFYDNVNRKCVVPFNCPNGQYADYQSRACVTKCNGNFADRSTKKCVDQCSGSTYADPLTGFCETTCSLGFIINVANNSCQSDCAVGLFKNPVNSSCSSACVDPYFADEATKSCVKKCTSNPLTFASTTNGRKCVSACLITQWQDLSLRKCVTTCPLNTYAYQFNRSCVLFCPSPTHYALGSQCVTNCSVQSKYSDDKLRQCVAICSSGYFRDPTTFKCVINCPQNYYTSNSLRQCTQNCPQGTYSDQQQGSCVTNCSTSPPLFAEQTHNKCVEMCPFNQFSDYTTYKCVTQCPTGYFTDNRTGQCKASCSDWFADSLKTPKACTNLCQTTTYADQTTQKCVSKCPSNYWALQSSRKCVQFCPFGFFAQNSTSKCVQKCPASNPYADSLTHMCVSKCSKEQIGFLVTSTIQWGTCVYYCPVSYFSNPLTGKCEIKCPKDYFSQTTNQTCLKTCPPNKLKDSINSKCVTQCPIANSLYGNRFIRQCVTECDPQLQIYADYLTQFCQTTCTGDQYKTKDLNGKNVCVSKNNCLNNLYSDPYMKACVAQCYNNTYGYNGICYVQCPGTLLFANPQTKTCVVAAGCPVNFFADSDKKKCVTHCDIATQTFADRDQHKCVKICEYPQYADNSTRQCVLKCPDIPQLFARQTDRVCVQRCSLGRFADQLTNKCETGCTTGYYADESTWKCVKKCPQGKFSDNTTNLCVTKCPQSQGYFGNPHPQSRQCVKNCPDGTFADPNNNRQCRPYCLSPMFAQNLTNTCEVNCKTGYSNQRTAQCIGICTSGFFGHQGVCYKYQCPSTSPTVFSDDMSSLCKTQCPQTTYGDISTRKCVKRCPLNQNTFAEQVNNLCVSSCPGGTFSDNSTRRCVQRCPQTPSLYASPNQKACLPSCTFDRYADNLTRSCITVTQCPFGTYADNSTMKCVTRCPTKPMMYGYNVTNKCVIKCPTQFDRYADNSSRTCVQNCPQSDNTFADPEKRTCTATCSPTYFAVNSTRKCRKTCPDGEFADNLLRKCVSKCPINPVYYGNRITKQCVSQCPTGSYGNPLTQQCVFDNSGVSNCPPDYFGDDTTKICLQNCSMKQNLYGDPLIKKCKLTCSDPSYLKDNSTMLCVTKCPNYPNYFADVDKKICIAYCPVQRWADELSRVCVKNCPVNTFAENSTGRCLSQCLKNPLTFASQADWRCVSKCPVGKFADFSTSKCVSKCPQLAQTFAENATYQCVKHCNANTFAQNSTRTCVQTCWNIDLADNSSSKCVSRCPSYPAYYANYQLNKCVQMCPVGYFAYQSQRKCVLQCPQSGLYRQNTTRRCVPSCMRQLNQYADNLTKYCVLRCSVDTWADPTTRKCVSLCPDQPLMYASNHSQTCVAVCPDPTWGDNQTRSCVQKCPTNSLSLEDKNLCVRYCPVGYFAYTQTAFCVLTCPQPYYGDPSTRTCVLECPLVQLLYADNSTRKCVKNCPALSYADRKTKFCVSQCPKAILLETQTYAADYNNKCVQQCALPTFAYLPTLKCYNKCPDPYFNNIIDHKCHLCPVKCTSCTSPNACLKCTPSYYLQNGQCVSQCSGIYYADTTKMSCVTSFSCKPNFGVNSTNKCQSNCPTGEWKNSNVFRCDACPKICETCISLTKCNTCKVNSTFYNSQCYEYCQNPVLRYHSYDNKTCLSQCTNGTYLHVLFCKPCNPICKNCAGSATNCSLCSDGLYLKNITCVATCGTGYKPTKERACSYCGDNCTQGLTFSTNMTQINGQTNVFMNFNTGVNITGNIYNTFKVQTTSKRLLIEQQYNLSITKTRTLQQSLPPYTIQVIDQKTIRIIFPPGYTAQNYQIKIINPENIQDQFGNIPSNVRSQVIVNPSDFYSTSISNVDSKFSSYFKFLAIICVFSVVFDTELMKFLQLIYVHYFVIMNLPPEFTKVLTNLRYSTLDYVPSIYPQPEVVLKWTVSGKVYDLLGDYSFLRNAGASITILFVVLIIFLVLKALSLPEINKSKTVRLWIKQVIDEKFTYAVWIQFMLIMYVNTVLMAFLQMRDYNNYDTFSMASLALSHIFVIACLAIIGILIYKIMSFFNQYPKLTQNLKKASDIIMKDQQFKMLHSSNIFLFQKKKIDLRNLMYPKVNNQNILPFRCMYRFNLLAIFSPVVTLLRLTILSAIMAFGTSTLIQMSMAIPLNILTLFYFSRARPYSFKKKKYRISNYIAIYHQVCLLIFEILMLILAIYQRDEVPASKKEEFSYYMIYYLTAVTIPSFIYFVFRTVIHVHRKVWLPFIQSELFRKNFPEKWAAFQAQKNKQNKLVKGIDPLARKALKQMLTGFKNKSSLRPSQKDKQNPQLPVKHKITFFDRDSSSVATSNTSMNRKQKKNMLKKLFASTEQQQDKQTKQFYEQMNNSQKLDVQTQVQYQEYEQEFQIKAKDLAKYVANAQQVMRLMKKQQQSDIE